VHVHVHKTRVFFLATDTNEMCVRVWVLIVQVVLNTRTPSAYRHK
jgi:hypothetical protein